MNESETLNYLLWFASGIAVGAVWREILEFIERKRTWIRIRRK